MSDPIDRQAAIDALERIFNQCEEIEAHLPDGDPDKTGYKMFPDYMTVWKYLRQLPSAERRGQWFIKKDVTFPHMVCSECKKPFYGNMNDTWNYCPYCGARMMD